MPHRYIVVRVPSAGDLGQFDLMNPEVWGGKKEMNAVRFYDKIRANFPSRWVGKRQGNQEEKEEFENINSTRV